MYHFRKIFFRCKYYFCSLCLGVDFYPFIRFAHFMVRFTYQRRHRLAIDLLFGSKKRTTTRADNGLNVSSEDLTDHRKGQMIGSEITTVFVMRTAVLSIYLSIYLNFFLSFFLFSFLSFFLSFFHLVHLYVSIYLYIRMKLLLII